MTASIASQLAASRTLSGLVFSGLLTAMGSAAVAQTPPATPDGLRAPNVVRDASPAECHMGYGDPAKMQARMANREAEQKATLKITPAQEAAWMAFTTAMKPPAGGMGFRQLPQQRAEMDKLPTPERIDAMRAQRSQRMTEMNAMADQRGDAIKVFYAQLSGEQKSVFDAEYNQHGMHHGGRHGGMKKG
jgi:hypothetical protein